MLNNVQRNKYNTAHLEEGKTTAHLEKGQTMVGMEMMSYLPVYLVYYGECDSIDCIGLLT